MSRVLQDEEELSHKRNETNGEFTVRQYWTTQSTDRKETQRAKGEDMES
jgi:hypothetical protein